MEHTGVGGAATQDLTARPSNDLRRIPGVAPKVGAGRRRNGDRLLGNGNNVAPSGSRRPGAPTRSS